MKFNWILFDADNTIFDFHASSEIAFHKSFQKHGIQSTAESYKLFKKINLATWKAFDENKISHEAIKEYRFSKLFEEIRVNGIDPMEFNTLYFKKLVENIRYVEGAKEILSYLKGKVKLAIITNGMKEVQRPRLESSEIYDFFELIIVSGEIGFSKPNHSFFQYVYDEMDDCEKEKVLVVGDNLFADIKGGNDFGFKTAWFNPDLFERKDGIVPNYELINLNEIKNILIN